MPLQLYALDRGQWRGFGEVGQADPTPVESGTFTFASSAIEGGGFQNAVAVSPFLNGSVRPYLIGADVSGPHRSDDRGATWVPCSAGSVGNSARVSAFLWSDITPGKAFIAEDNGIHVSTNWGVSWTKRAAPADWDGNNDSTVALGEHPRQTGYLLAQDNSTTTHYLWAGTKSLGVRQSIDDAASWRTTVLSGHPIRSIALDPNDRDTLYVAVNRGTAAQNGMWRITNARAATMTATKMTGYPGTVAAPVGPEEIICVNVAGTTQVYVAGHESGMCRYTPSTNTWATINTGLVLAGPVYRSLCVDPTNPSILYCGCWHPNNRRAIFQSTNGGNSWVPITGPAPATAPATGPVVIDWRMFGTNVRSWLADIGYHSFAGPNQDWIPAMLAVDPDVPNRVLAAGRGGAWWGTLTNDVRTWQPAVHGLMVTVNMCVAVDELTPGRALVGSMDYTAIYTGDGGVNAIASTPSGPGSTGDAACFDMAVTSGPARVYVGKSVRGQATGSGSLYSSTNPDAGPASTWTDEVAGAFNSDVVAVAVGKTSGGTRVILCGVSNTAGSTVGGLWRKVGASWSQLRDPASVPFGRGDTGGANNMGCLRFRRDSAVAYALDDDAVWRSNDAGATWVRILTGVTAIYQIYNALELDPTDDTKVYVSSGGTVRRINNASTSTGPADTSTTTIWAGNAANIALNADGSEMFINIRDGRLMRSTAFRTAGSQTAAGWTDVANPLFRAQSGPMRSLAVTADGVILTADNGSGVFRGVRV